MLRYLGEDLFITSKMYDTVTCCITTCMSFFEISSAYWGRRCAIFFQAGNFNEVIVHAVILLAP